MMVPPSPASTPPPGGGATPREEPSTRPGPPPPRSPYPGRWDRQLTAARNQLFVFFFFFVFLFLLYQLYRVFSPFLGPIIWAAIFAMVFYPLYLAVLRRLNGRRTAAAAAMTTLVGLLIVVPTASLSGIVTAQSGGLYRQLTEYVQSGALNQRVQQIRDSRPGRFVQRLSRQGWQIDVGEMVRTAIERGGNFAVTQVTTFARNVALFLLDLTIMLFTLFFFFRDGDRMSRNLRDLVPMDPQHKDTIFYRTYDTLSAVVRGMVVTAIVQGLLVWIGLLIAGVPYAAFLGVLAGILSFVPLVGPAGIWVPVTLYLAVVGDWGRALFMLLYGSLGVSLADNILRPLLIGERVHIPTVFLFFAILGGIEAYGILGLFLGPVLLALVVSFIKIYRAEYATGTSAASLVPAASVGAPVSGPTPAVP
jgi:predicted PurR-regulated permease PerM